jgi:hypothetical protein
MVIHSYTVYDDKQTKNINWYVQAANNGLKQGWAIFLNREPFSFFPPLGHTFEKSRIECDIQLWNLNWLCEKSSSQARQKDLGGADLARGPDFADPWAKAYKIVSLR